MTPQEESDNTHTHNFSIVLGTEIRRERGKNVTYIVYGCTKTGCTEEETKKP